MITQYLSVEVLLHCFKVLQVLFVTVTSIFFRMVWIRRPIVTASVLLLSISAMVQGQDEDVFQATNDWQEIREGQKVPSGLHYRMNLETGKKEARLLSEEDSGKGKFVEHLVVAIPIQAAFVIRSFYIIVLSLIHIKKKHFYS